MIERVDAALEEQPKPENGEEGAIGDISLERRFFKPQTLISFLVAFAIIYFLLTKINIDFGQTFQRVKGANPLFYLLALLVFYVSFLVRGWRWQVLLRNVGFRQRHGVRLPALGGLVEIVLLSWFANCIMPAKLGDAYRGYLLKKSAGVSFSKTMGTVVAERMVDTVMLFVLMALAGLRVFHGTVPDAFASMLIAGAVLVFVILFAFVVMIRFSAAVKFLVPQRFKPMYHRFHEGTFLSFQNMPLIVVLSGAVWLSEAGRLWFVLAAMGVPNVGLSVVLFVALAGSLLTTLPFTPAGLGVVESALIGLFILLGSLGIVQGVDEVMAASIAVLDRLISYWSLVFIGFLVYVISRKR